MERFFKNWLSALLSRNFFALMPLVLFACEGIAIRKVTPLTNNENGFSQVAASSATIPPTLSTFTVTNSSPTNTRNYALVFGTITGAYNQYCIQANNTLVSSCSWTTGALPSIFVVPNLSASYTLTAWVKNAAGASNAVNSNAVVFDNSVPSITSVTVTNGTHTNSTTYNLSYVGITGPYSHYCIQENNTAIGSCAWTAGVLPASKTVAATENAKVLTVWIRNSAGTSSAGTDSNSVILDTTQPTLSLTQPNGGELLSNGGSYNITWTGSDTNMGATPITIEVSSNSGGAWSNVASNVAHPSSPASYSWTVPGVNLTTYRIRVTATDLAGNSRTVTSAADFSVVGIPTVPASLTATGGQSNIALSWSASTGASPITYDIYRSTTSGSYGAALVTGHSSTTYADLTALNGTTYYYVVRATNPGGSSAVSNEASARPISSFAISAVAVNDTAGGSALQISWGAATGAAAYTLKYGTVSGTYGTTVSTNATSPATVTGLTPGTTYYFMVTATNAIGGGASVDANAEMSGVPEAAFSISSVTQPTSSQATVAWGASAGSTSYAVRYGTVSGTYGTTVTTSGVSPQNVTGLTDGTTYYFRVFAVNASGSLSSSSETSYTPVAVPSVPASLTATGGVTSVALAWSAATGGGTITYNVYRSTTSGSFGAALATGVATTTYNDTTAVAGTTYYYIVRSSNAGGLSADSNEASARPIAAFTLSSVAVNDTAGASALQISWGAPTGAAAYTLRYGTVSGTYGTTVSTSATSPTTVTGLTPGTTYFFMVTATNSIGGGANANATAEMSGVPEAAFTISSVTQPGSGQATVTWAASTGSASYTVRYGTVSGTYGTTFTTAGVSPHLVTGLTDGTTYYFRVFADNANGSLSSTAETSFTPTALPSVPASLTATGGISNVGLSWSASTGGAPITYNVYRSTTSGSYGAALVTGLSGTTYSDLTALNGTTYYYVVRAVNPGGTTGDSNEVSARPISSFTIDGPYVNGFDANTLRVWWTAATGASAYTLKYGTTSGSYTTTVSTNAANGTDVIGLTPGTTYYFMVTATNAVGSGTSVDATSETSGVPEAAFTISSVTQPASSQATVTWGASTGSSSFTVRYGTVSGTYGTTVTTSGVSPQNVTGLTNGTTYYFRVFAVNANGSLQSSNETSFTPVAAPGVPASLTATGGIANVGLSWSASSGGGTITYDVYRSTTSGSYGAALATGVSGTTYSDLTALNGTTYYYVVRATNEGGSSSNSNEASARPISSFTISSVDANNTAGGSALQVSWGSATGAAAYTLKYGTVSGTYGTTVSTNATSPTSVTGLTAGTTYYFMVVATNAVGGGASVDATAEGSGKPMAAFAITAATQSGSGQVDISWNSSAGANSYLLQYGTVSGTYGTDFSTNATSPTTVTGLTNGTTYYFRVSSMNASGILSSTNEMSATPVAAPGSPTTLTATGGDTSVALSWTASSGGGTITYNIYRSTTSGSYGAAIATGVSGNTYSSTGLTNGTTYYYRVTATNGGGTSGNSNEASAVPDSITFKIDFTLGSYTPSIGTQALTFSRADTAPVATHYGSDGKLRYAPHNFNLRSEEIDSAVTYYSDQTTVTANAVTAPNGTTTAETVTETTAAGDHTRRADFTKPAIAAIYTYSIYAKAGARNFLELRTESGGGGVFTRFNIQTGTYLNNSGYGTGWTYLSSNVQSVGNGWYRLSTTSMTDTSTTYSTGVRLMTDATTGGYAGDGIGSVHLWGAQAERNISASPYVATTTAEKYDQPRFDYAPSTLLPRGLLMEQGRTNLILQSETMSVGPWTSAGSGLTTATADSTDTTDPMGGNGAEKLTEPASGSNSKIWRQTISKAAASYTYSFSVYTKKDTVTRIGLRLQATGASDFVSAEYDINGGFITDSTTSGGYSAGSAEMYPVGNGWFRCILHGTSNTSTTIRPSIYLLDASATTVSPNYTSSSKGMYVWGAQLETPGASNGTWQATSYIPTTTVAVTRASEDLNGTPGSWYNASDGTFYLDWEMNNNRASSAGQTVMALTNAGTDDFVLLSGSAEYVGLDKNEEHSNNVAFFNSGYGQVNHVSRFKAAYTIKPGDIAMTLNDSAVQTSSYSPSTATTLRFGQRTSGYYQPMTGWLREVRYYPSRLTNGELATLTASTAATFTDTFADGTRDAHWADAYTSGITDWITYEPNNVAVSESSGTLNTQLPDNVTGWGGYAQASSKNMVGKYVSVEIPSAGASTSSANHSTEMVLEPAVGHSITLFITANSSGSNIGAEFQDATLCGGWCSLGTNTYDNINQRYIRIRHDELNDIIYFEASPDGSAWVYFDAIARPYSLTATKTAILSGGYEAGIGGPVNSSFDNFKTTGQ